MNYRQTIFKGPNQVCVFLPSASAHYRVGRRISLAMYENPEKHWWCGLTLLFIWNVAIYSLKIIKNEITFNKYPCLLETESNYLGLVHYSKIIYQAETLKCCPTFYKDFTEEIYWIILYNRWSTTYPKCLGLKNVSDFRVTFNFWNI